MRSRVRLWPLLAAVGAGVVGMTAPASAQMPGAGVAANGVGTAFELAFWQSVGTNADPASYQAYLEQYPGGTFAALARAKIAAARRMEPVVMAMPVAPVPAVVAVAPPIMPAPVAVAPLPVAAAPEPAMRMIPAMIAPFPVQTAVQATAQATAPQPAGSVIGNAALLAALAQSQIGGGAPMVAMAPALPAPPVLTPVPTLAVPDRFCSAEARNQYHDTVYKPAMAQAAANNAAAIRYLQALDAQYRASGAQSDAAAMNAVAAGSRAYQPVAGEAFATSTVYLKLFDRIMATPIHACRAS